MPSIKARIAALSELLQRQSQGIRAVSYKDMDPISQSMMDLVYELEALDTVGKKAAYCEKCGLDLDQLEGFIRSITVDY